MEMLVVFADLLWGPPQSQNRQRHHHHHHLLLFPILLTVFLLAFLSPIVSSLSSSSSSPHIQSPCQLPPSAAANKFGPFCQLPYHQVPYICDPGAILSRTEAELIDRRLRPGLNLTGCMCPSRQLCAQQDRRLAQFRAIVLLVPSASTASIRKCMKERNSKNFVATNSKATTESSGQRSSEEEEDAGFASATGQFARLAVDKLLGSSAKGSSGSGGERCDPDLLLLYIDRWSSRSSSSAADQQQRRPYVARIFRRNLAHLRDLSQVERVDQQPGGAAISAFEVLSEQLERALRLAMPEGFGNQQKSAQKSASKQHRRQHQQNTLMSPAAVADGWAQPPPRTTEPIPSWAMLSALGLVSLAIGALFLAHWVTRRISLMGHQKKFSTASRMSTRSTRTEEAVPISGGNSHQAKISASGSSARGTVTFGPGTSGGGGGVSTSASHLKSQMMFRQFSRKTGQRAQAQAQQQTRKI